MFTNFYTIVINISIFIAIRIIWWASFLILNNYFLINKSIKTRIFWGLMIGFIILFINGAFFIELI